MSPVEALMEGLRVRLAAVPGLNASATRLADVTPPQAVVGVPPIGDYRSALVRGRYELSPTVTVFTSKSLDWPGQLLLARLASASGEQSIPAAIEADRTLGGVVEDCQVTAFRPLDGQEVALVGYWGGLFTLRALVNEQPDG